MFYKYGVDLEIWAHEHFYERLWPIYDQKVYNGSYSEPYTNPGSPVHITTGSAVKHLTIKNKINSHYLINVFFLFQGCPEGLNLPVSKPTNWSALRIEDYGFSRMTILNNTHLKFEQLSVDKVII